MCILPRKENPFDTEVKKAIISKNYITKVGELDELPAPSTVRDVLDKLFAICRNRDFRLILVEDFGDYKIFIQIPGTKSACDFFVWRAILKDNTFIDIKIPTHDDLGKMYLELKEISPNVEEYLINAVIRLLRDRMSINEIMERYFRNEPSHIKLRIMKFLATLKWIGLQEDTNYPPPSKLGSKFTLAVYALLEAGFNLKDIRRLLKWGKIK